MLIFLPRIRIPLTRLPLIRGGVSEFDRRMGESGIKGTFHWMAKKMNISVDVQMSERTHDVLKNGPVIILCNHFNILDPVPLSEALPGREDMKAIASSSMQQLGPHTSKYLLLVYIRDTYRIRSRSLLSKLGLIMSTADDISEEMKTVLNRKALRLAGEHAQHGGSVLLFPEGTRHGGEWFPGVGYIVSSLKKRNVKIVFAHLSNISSRDFIRLTSLPSRRKTCPVRFSEPISVGDVLNESKEPKIIRDVLQEKYQEWSVEF